MANGYVIINSLKYRITWGTFDDSMEPARSVDISVSGKTLTQNFAFTGYGWAMTLSVKYTEGQTGYGSIADLKAAFALDYTDFTDPFGNSHSVIFDGVLRTPHEDSITFPAVPVKIPIKLIKRQVT